MKKTFTLQKKPAYSKNAHEIMFLLEQKNSGSELWPEERMENNFLIKSSSKSLAQAKKTIPHTLPTVTKTGIDMMKAGGNYGAGLPIAFFGAGADLIKAPFVLLIAGVEVSYGGITKLLAMICKNSIEKKQLNRFNKNFLLCMQDTAQLLIDLGLETQEELSQKIQTDQMDDLIGLTYLLLAYISRSDANGLLLTSWKTKLTSNNCLEEAKQPFHRMMNLKSYINDAISFAEIDPKNSHRPFAEAKLFSKWFVLINAGRLLTADDLTNTINENQLDCINKIISEIAEIKVEIHNSAQEVKHVDQP